MGFLGLESLAPALAIARVPQSGPRLLPLELQSWPNFPNRCSNVTLISLAIGGMCTYMMS